MFNIGILLFAYLMSQHELRRRKHRYTTPIKSLDVLSRGTRDRN